MEQFITKKELADLLDKCIRLGVYMQEGPAARKAPDELAQMMFDGGLSLDIAALKHELADKEAKLERERLLDERRGGLSHEDETRALAVKLGYIPVVPPKSNRKNPWSYDTQLYKQRNQVERLFRRLKRFRRIFTRYDKLDTIFLAFIYFALIVDALM